MTGTQAIRPDWIAVDWGTTACRAWAMSGDTVLAEARSARGMGTLERSEFEGALLDLVSDWLDRPARVIACGMVGARQGWVEAPYTRVPADPRAVTATRAPAADPRLDVTVLGGLRQDEPPDVMRGEETQIAGALALRPGFDGILCLPGTHTKWVQVSAGEVTGFRTFVTGEMFALMSTQSVLRHSVGEGWDDAAFLDAVSDTLSRPEGLAQRFFAIRAEHLLHGLAPGTARARLSGLLIGAELAAARPFWLGRNVIIVGAGSSAAPYEQALAAEGVPADRLEADAMTRAGLAAARTRLGDAE